MDVDIVFVQEPYLAKLSNGTSLVNAPAQYESFHNLSEVHAFGSLILAKRSLNVQQASISCLNHFATAAIKLQDGHQINLMSIYARPSMTNFKSLLLDLRAIPLKLLERSIICGDLNAENLLWSSKK